MRDQLIELIDDNLTFDEAGNLYEYAIESVADAIIAALPDMVQPLVWMEGGSDSFMHDADFVDTTQTYQIQEGLFWYAAEVQGVPCGSNDAAKAAAQADYTRRILSAFGITEGET